MTDVYEVSAARKPIGIAEKRQYFNIIVLTRLF